MVRDRANERRSGTVPLGLRVWSERDKATQEECERCPIGKYVKDGKWERMDAQGLNGNGHVEITYLSVKVTVRFVIPRMNQFDRVLLCEPRSLLQAFILDRVLCEFGEGVQDSPS